MYLSRRDFLTDIFLSKEKLLTKATLFVDGALENGVEGVSVWTDVVSDVWFKDEINLADVGLLADG